jgi:ribulose-phosphate 3-epimerase
MPLIFEKIAALRRLADALHPTLEIEVDGNVSFEHAPRMVEQGADLLVAGSSSIFAPGVTLSEGCRRLRESCAS